MEFGKDAREFKSPSISMTAVVASAALVNVGEGPGPVVYTNVTSYVVPRIVIASIPEMTSPDSAMLSARALGAAKLKAKTKQRTAARLLNGLDILDLALV